MNVKRMVLLLLSPLFLLFPNLSAKEPWEIADKKFKIFAEKMAKKNHMECLSVGAGLVVDSRRVIYDINLTSDKQLTLEQARPLVLSIIRDFVDEITQNPIYQRKQDDMGKHSSWYDPKFTPAKVGLKIAFWDANVDRPLPPYLAQIKVLEGRIEYYQTNPKDQSLQLPPVVESVDDLLSKNRV